MNAIILPIGHPIDLAVGSYGACAVTADHAMECTGAGRFPRVLERPRLAGPFQRVAVGVDHVCGVVVGSLACRGPDAAFAGLDTLTDVIDVVATDDGTCVRTMDQRVRCSAGLQTLPDRRYAALFANTHVVCGTTEDAVICRGAWTDFVTPAVPLAPDALVPRAPSALLRVGGSFACLLDGGNLDCFGTGGLGELGEQVPSVFTPFQPPLPAATRLDSGEWRTCLSAVDGAVGCFGVLYTDGGALARPFTPVDLVGPVRRLDTGVFESCAILGDGALQCYFGRRSRVDRGPYVELAIGNGLGCVVRADGSIDCFVPGDERAPARVNTSTFGVALDVAVAGESACAVFADGDIACWGANTREFIQPGGPPSLSRPVHVGRHARSSTITLGLEHGCVLDDAGTAACFGNNAWGQLGRSPNDVSYPLGAVMGGPYVDIDAGIFHTCAARRDGRVDCFGQSYVARLGRIEGGAHGEPTEVPGVIDAIDVSVGREHACARVRSGSIACWGWSPTGTLTGASPAAAQPIHVAR